MIETKAPQAKDFTNKRVRRNGELDEATRSKKRSKSRVRARIERTFAVINRLWGFTKVRYRGLAKNATRSFVVLGLANRLFSVALDHANAPGTFRAALRLRRSLHAEQFGHCAGNALLDQASEC